MQAINPVRFIGNQFEVKGFAGDLAGTFKLADYLTKTVYGAKSELSGRITNAGALFKNYFDAVSVFGSAADVGRDFLRLDGTVRKTAEFVSSTLTLLKNAFGAAELGNKLLGEEYVSSEDLKFYSPISGFATLAFAGLQVIDHSSEFVTQFGAGNASRATSAFFKLAKFSALVGVGAIALIAAFHSPAPAVAIPVLLSIGTVSSVVSRFFDGLVLPLFARQPDQAPPANPPAQEVTPTWAQNLIDGAAAIQAQLADIAGRLPLEPRAWEQ